MDKCVVEILRPRTQTSFRIAILSGWRKVKRGPLTVSVTFYSF